MSRRAGRAVKPASGPQRLVATGSSAGGLEALVGLVGYLVPDSLTAYVVAQHVAPDYPSVLVDLLSNDTQLRVVVATNGQALEPDVVAVAAPNREVTVSDGRLRVSEPQDRLGPHPSIDLLFESVAREWGDRGIGVLLSGTGSDGTIGMSAIKSAGGVAIAQSPESAKFQAMPQSATAQGAVDLVLDPPDIALWLMARTKGVSGDGVSADQVVEDEPAALTRLCSILRLKTQIDFSGYKVSTLRRQMARRMLLREQDSVDDYLATLESDPDEVSALVANLLVTVTSFFRDPDAFDALADQIRTYVHTRASREPLRVWVPGCATGEEAYSLAMVFAKILGQSRNLEDRLKIFATDLDESSLTVARSAVYPASALSQIPEELRADSVVVGETEFQISPDLRASVVFTRHNIAQDPPLPRMDLVSCRNTLIYFTPEFQGRASRSITYSLLPGGLLFLGAKESVGSALGSFEVVDAAHKILSRTQKRASVFVPTGRSTAWIPQGSGVRFKRQPVLARDAARDSRMELLEALVGTFRHPCVVLDDSHDLVEVVGDVSRFCQLPPGPASVAAESFLRPELLSEARALLLLIRGGGERSKSVTGRPIELAGADNPVRLEARLLTVADRSLFALSFIEEPLDVTSLRQIDRDPTFDDELRRLEHELLEGQKRWRESIEDLETTYEELQAANEELHAVNDELVDLSREARVRAVDLQAVNADLANIEQLLTQGLVLLDADLLVTRFTPMAVRLFALVAADIGRALLDVPTTMPVTGLAEALRSVRGGGDRVNIECSGDSATFLVQVLPYVAAPGALRGAIVAFSDISEQATLRRAAERARGSLIRIASALQEVVWQRDVDTGELLFVSSQVLQLSGWTSEEVLVRPGLLDECVDEQDRDAVRAARRTADEAWSVTYRFNPREGGQRWVLESGTKARDNERVTLVASLMDITDRRGAETAAAQASLVFESVFSTDLFGVAVLDADEKIVLANDTLAEWVGRSADSLVGQRISELSQPAPEGHELVTGELQMARSVSRILHQNGSKRWVTIDSRPLCGGAEAGVAIAVVQDATGLLEARHDAMTGLLNRKSVWEALELDVARAGRSNRQVGLLCIDIDRFKEINDHDGHEAGDLVLGAFAQRVKSVVRTHEATGRLGGDEFAVVLSDYESEGALEATIERILAAIREPIVVGGVEFALSGSIGVAQFPQDATCAEDLMRAADTAMYQAKARGGDRFEHFQHSMTVLADRRLQIRQDMVKAVEDHDFEMYYQPIVAVDDSVWGVEALVRWNRGGEVVVASEFISATESSGQMRSLGTVVFGLLGTDVELMCAAGFGDVPISVNMSTTQLEDPALTSLLTAWPAATGMTNVVLEVTESVFLPNHSRARRVLERLTQFGADVCVDDFGSGFSNLSLLRELSPAFTKLDRMFLADPVAAEAGRTQGDAEVATELVDRAHSAQIALMTSAIEMGHALGAKVVVAGIETRDQRDLATRLGADFLQGFAIAEPMPMPELVRWLKDRSGTA